MEVEINIRFKIISDCKHERWYFSCPECGQQTNPFAPEESKTNVFRNICGIDGSFFIVECPKCFHRYKFHCGDGGYTIFERIVESGLNLHFKPIGSDKSE
jgi:hypothetical protein